MNKRIITLGAILLILLLGFGIYYFVVRSDDSRQNQEQSQQQTNNTRKTCIADECLKDQSITFPVATIPTDIQSVMNKAIADEYAARATYQTTINKFGSIRPFNMIVRSEEQHVSAIKALFDKYGIAIPADTTSTSAPETVRDACAQGVSVEQADIALYNDTVLPAVHNYPDMVTVFTNLRDASYSHLTAFQKCD